MNTALPRTFHLQRHRDVSGVSGTGIVALGVHWPDGTATVRWLGDRPSTVVWGSIADAEHVHGHQGATELVWHDQQQPPAEGVFVRGFRLHLRDGQVLHGVQWPDGRALVADDSEAGLVTAAGSVDQLLAGGYHGARLEWAPTTHAPLASCTCTLADPCPTCPPMNAPGSAS
ncbi:hypothetical protein [Streptomyces sp. NPDC047968]|uniref:hypothetical protein n=1 Tax=unclassified Streptomyces TaxID=2593676 RepID=UPI00342FE26A